MCHLHFLKKNEYIKANLLHNILKIGQKSVSKLSMMSQEIFTYSKSTTETLEVRILLMSLFLPLSIIHTIFESLLLNLNRKIFIQIASSDYETLSTYIDFLPTIKHCCQVHIQAALLFKIISIGMFQKEARFCYFLRNNLACLGGYPIHLDVADMSNLFYFHFAFT